MTQPLTAAEQIAQQIEAGNRVVRLRTYLDGRRYDMRDADLTLMGQTDRDWVIAQFHANNPSLHYYGEGKNSEATERAIAHKVSILASIPTGEVYFANFGDGFVALTAEQYAEETARRKISAK